MALEDNLRHMAAADIFAEMPDIEDDMETMPSGEDSMTFLRKLVAGKTPEEALTFAAFMLQPRLAVWWGHECLRLSSDLLEPQDETMLDIAATWVADPTEANRYHAMGQANAVKVKTPGVWIALAVAWSGGSLADREFDPVPPPPILCGRAVHTGILTLLARFPIPERADRLKGFVNMAEVLATSD